MGRPKEEEFAREREYSTLEFARARVVSVEEGLGRGGERRGGGEGEFAREDSGEERGGEGE